ncbi:hypothetical protein FE257_000676 [Aspergillus nanangensis]|uniref:Uncharacterized protein n=1 Tax=Aspergillus nanangensis TaxID=2582783 RepID=A0AAD4CEW3_ASPNN|nr:hypothetical protein FE257_000676 [Aspergillus nanangensis]
MDWLGNDGFLRRTSVAWETAGITFFKERLSGHGINCIYPSSHFFLDPRNYIRPHIGFSPHVSLLGMLFRIRAFKTFSTDGIVVDCTENLYNLDILEMLGQQKLRLKDEILNKFVFCQAVREADGT